MHFFLLPASLRILGWAAAIFGVGGTICSAYIYLVPARPAWNMIHTPLDFLLTTAFLGSLLASVADAASRWVERLIHLNFIHFSQTSFNASLQPALLFAALWAFNQVLRRVRLSYSRLFERRASASLLGTESLQAVFFTSFALVALAAFFMFARLDVAALLTGIAGILLTRYLFFVSVVPLNMALTFVRGGRH